MRGCLDLGGKLFSTVPLDVLILIKIKYEIIMKLIMKIRMKIMTIKYEIIMKIKGAGFTSWGICVLTPTFKYNCDFTLIFFPLASTIQCDFTSSQRSKLG